MCWTHFSVVPISWPSVIVEIISIPEILQPNTCFSRTISTSVTSNRSKLQNTGRLSRGCVSYFSSLYKTYGTTDRKSAFGTYSFTENVCSYVVHSHVSKKAHIDLMPSCATIQPAHYGPFCQISSGNYNIFYILCLT